jgi:hypothetical protein
VGRVAARRRSARWLVAVALLVVAAVTAVGVGAWLARQRAEAMERAVAAAARAVGRAVAVADLAERQRSGRRAAEASLRGRAAEAASERVGGAVRTWSAGPEQGLRDRFVALVARGAFEEAGRVLALWRPADDDPVAVGALVDHLVGTGELAQARELAWAGAERFEAARGAFVRRFYASHTADPAFWRPEPLTLVPGGELTRIRPLAAASSVLLLLEEGSRTWGVVKPEQTNPWSSYRGELAAYRLCPLIHCAVSIPRNVEVRIREDDLAALMGLAVEAVRELRRHDYAPVFFEEEGTRWLYGTLKEWVPGFTSFPIERTHGWRRLVNGSIPESRLRSMTLREALSELAAADPVWWASFEARQAGTTPFELAHQLSDLHVLDVLINNWDRYSSSEPGSNCQWHHGQLVSIDNGASFHTPEEWVGRDVHVRLRRVRRFSRRTIDAVRWMDTAAMFEVLFPPNPHFDDERERYHWFLERRRFVLDWVDQQVARYGEEGVFIFP